MANFRWLVPVALVGGVAGLLLLSRGTAGRQNVRDFVGDSLRALQKTTEEASTATKIDEGVDRFLGLFESFDPAELPAAARQVYASTAYFNDGFAEFTGNDTIAEYLARTAEATASLEIVVEDRVVTGSDVYLRWIMTFETRGMLSRVISAPGVSHLRFDSDGRVVFHQDYWDASGALAEFVPGLSSILRAVRHRLEKD